MRRPRSPVKWEHDLFQDNESKEHEQEEMAIIDNEDDSMKWRQATINLSHSCIIVWEQVCSPGPHGQYGIWSTV